MWIFTSTPDAHCLAMQIPLGPTMYLRGVNSNPWLDTPLVIIWLFKTGSATSYWLYSSCMIQKHDTQWLWNYTTYVRVLFRDREQKQNNYEYMHEWYMVIYGIYAQVVGRSKSTKMYVGQWTEKRWTLNYGRKKGDKRARNQLWKKNATSTLKSSRVINHHTKAKSARSDGRSIASLSVTTSRCCSRRDDSISMRIISWSTSYQPSLWKIPACKSCTASSSATTSKWKITRFAVDRLFDIRCDIFDFLCINAGVSGGREQGMEMTYPGMFL